MISVLSMAIGAVTSIVVSVLKAFFSMLSWFLRAYIKFLKLFFSILPITAVSFFLLLCINIFLLFGGNFGFLAIGGGPSPQIQVPHSIDIPMGDMNIPKEMVKEAGNSFSNNNYVVTTFYNEIKSWWIESVYSYKGAPLYIFLLILTVIMVIPVATILLSISVFMSFGKIIFFCIIADTAIYVIRAILGKGFITQALDRYYHLFPDAGKRHYEKDYEKWLKNRSYEDSYEKDNIRRKKRAAFYEDNEYEDEYEDELDDDYDEEYDDEFDDDYDEEYDTESEDDYEEDFDGESDEGSNQRVNNNTSTSSGSFDFFAGCTSRESIDKKYKSLVKLYHPDNMDGDTAALQEINVQYDKAKKHFS